MKEQILLNDLLQLTEDELSYTRIKLNTYNGTTHPIDTFKRNPEELLHWNYWNNKSYKIGQISIGLVNMGYDKWLLFTIGIITKLLDVPYKGDGSISTDGTGIQVEYETLTRYSALFGRVIIEFHNNARQTFKGGWNIDQLVVKEILPSVFTGFDFPGYENVSLTFEQLATIINGEYPSYHNALRNQKAVYLITDRATGKLYVGSATSQYGMLLTRWSNYVGNGHGGNVELKALVEKNGFNYVKQYFQYTIIENYNAKVDDSIILERESYWKTVLQTKIFGYNKN